MNKPLHAYLLHPHVPRNVNELHNTEHLGISKRLAVLLTKGFGSMMMLYIFIAWVLAWMVLADGGIWLFAQDRYPYPFLLFCCNLIQLFALPILAVGQQVLSRKAELQADEEFCINQKSLHDIEQIAIHLDKQDQIILTILRRLEKEEENYDTTQ